MQHCFHLCQMGCPEAGICQNGEQEGACGSCWLIGTSTPVGYLYFSTGYTHIDEYHQSESVAQQTGTHLTCWQNEQVLHEQLD
jgi:hypothetical protein